MAGVVSKPGRSGRYRAWFIDHQGTQKFFRGTKNKSETRRKALELEAAHWMVRSGVASMSTIPQRSGNRSFKEIKAEYLDWGRSQGGRNGLPWGKTHQRNRESHLLWWETKLKLEKLNDLEGVLPAVEKALRKLQSEGMAGKTVANYGEALSAFCDWCVKRQYLAFDPLRNLSSFNTAPVARRRNMTGDEFEQLLLSCPNTESCFIKLPISQDFV